MVDTEISNHLLDLARHRSTIDTVYYSFVSMYYSMNHLLLTMTVIGLLLHYNEIGTDTRLTSNTNNHSYYNIITAISHYSLVICWIPLIRHLSFKVCLVAPVNMILLETPFSSTKTDIHSTDDIIDSYWMLYTCKYTELFTYYRYPYNFRKQPANNNLYWHLTSW
jgi:hypothetical protein